MAGETVINLIGNVVEDPELRWTSGGAAVAKFRVASTPRTFNKQTDAWEDGESLYLTCSVWRQQAENVAGSVEKGMRVVIQGRLKQRSYEDREGVKRTVYEIDAEEVAVSLKNATAKVTKAGKGGGQQGYGQSQAQQQSAGSGDPWGQAAQNAGAAAGQQWGGGGDEPPPF